MVYQGAVYGINSIWDAEVSIVADEGHIVLNRSSTANVGDLMA